MDSILARRGRGKAPAAPLQGSASVSAQGHNAGRGRLPFRRRATARQVVHRCTSLQGIASPVASPRPQQNPFVSFRAALPRSRGPCTCTTAAPCHLRRPCTCTTAAPCKGSAGAKGVCFTWNVSAVTVVYAIVAYATIRIGFRFDCSLIIV